MIWGLTLYKIAVCDDVSVDIDNIVNVIKKESNESNIWGINYFLYKSGYDLLKNINENFDVIILDIQMEKMDGKEVAALIRKVDLDVILVFCSAIRVPSPDLFRVQPYRYITKQFIKKDMEIDIREVLHKMISSPLKYFSAFRNGNSLKINLNHIVCISLLKRGCEIFILAEALEKYGCEKIYCEKSLKQVYEQIHDDRFVYAHNSYIVNVEHIIKSTRTEVILSNDIILTIARSKEKFLRKRMIEYYGNKYSRKGNIL